MFLYRVSKKSIKTCWSVLLVVVFSNLSDYGMEVSITVHRLNITMLLYDKVLLLGSLCKFPEKKVDSLEI